MNKSILAISLALILSGCNDSDSGTGPVEPPKPEIIPPTDLIPSIPLCDGKPCTEDDKVTDLPSWGIPPQGGDNQLPSWDMPSQGGDNKLPSWGMPSQGGDNKLPDFGQELPTCDGGECGEDDLVTELPNFGQEAPSCDGGVCDEDDLVTELPDFGQEAPTCDGEVCDEDDLVTELPDFDQDIPLFPLEPSEPIIPDVPVDSEGCAIKYPDNGVYSYGPGTIVVGDNGMYMYKVENYEPSYTLTVLGAYIPDMSGDNGSTKNQGEYISYNYYNGGRMKVSRSASVAVCNGNIIKSVIDGYDFRFNRVSDLTEADIRSTGSRNVYLNKQNASTPSRDFREGMSVNLSGGAGNIEVSSTYEGQYSSFMDKTVISDNERGGNNITFQVINIPADSVIGAQLDGVYHFDPELNMHLSFGYSIPNGEYHHVVDMIKTLNTKDFKVQFNSLL